MDRAKETIVSSSKEKLIRLDDLITEKKVAGRRQLFGVTYTTHDNTKQIGRYYG